MDEAALDPDALADALGRRPDDLELRARAIDALRRRGHPGARLLELDARRYATPRAAPELVALDEEQRAVAAELDPTWIIRAGERDAERVDLVIRDPTSRLALGTPSHRAVFGVQLPRGSSPLALKPDVRGLIVVERALRRADAVAALDALIEHSDPDTRQWCLEQRARTGEHPFAVAPQPSPAATALARLRWLVPQPWRWVVEQPSFNGAWRRRAPAGQRSPAPGPIVDDEVDVVLTSVGTERKAVLRELRGLLDGRPLRELATMLQGPPVTLVSSIRGDDAQRMSARLERAGAAVKLLRAGYTERFELGDDGVELDGGDPGLVALAGSTDTLTVLRYRVTWPHPHEPTPAHQERAAFPLEGCTRTEALTRLRAALDEVIAARLRGFQTCRYCQQSTPPEWWHGEGACSGCAERHLGVVH